MNETLNDLVLRYVEEADLDRVAPLIQSFHDEQLGQYGLTFDPVTARGLMLETIKNHVAICAEIADELVGVIAGMSTPYGMNTTLLIFQESIWYVMKAHRSLSVGLKMLRALEEECRIRGIHRIIMGNMSTDRDDHFSRFFLSQGYRPMEVHFIKDLTA